MSAFPALITRLEKAAFDNGFDRELGQAAGWLAYSSTHSPLDVWLTAREDGRILVALSRTDVARALTDLGTSRTDQPPPGGAAVLGVETIGELGRLLRRAFQLARTLPNELLRVFEQKTASMPRTTEAERLVVQRVGQDVFRAGLMDYWEGKCAITGLAVPELLRASHIKPWADCETDAERLDVFNGLLLAPHLDAAFDKGLITVDADGRPLVSARLAESDRVILGWVGPLPTIRLSVAHRTYLDWHRSHLFLG